MLARRLLGVPVIVWALQLLYVALALGLLAILTATVGGRVTRLPFQLAYVAVMIIVNIVWRLALRKKIS